MRQGHVSQYRHAEYGVFIRECRPFRIIAADKCIQSTHIYGSSAACMNPYVILCIDQDPFVVEQLSHDLAPFRDLFDLCSADTPDDAYALLSDFEASKQQVALLICHNIPGDNHGIDLLVNVDNYTASQGARTILLSDAPQYDIILQAVNEGRLNYCMHKPWRANELQRVAEKELTTYVLRYCQHDLLRYADVLDHRTLLDAQVEREISQFQSQLLAPAKTDKTAIADRVIAGLYAFFEGNDESRACRTYSANHVLTKENQDNAFLWFIADGEVGLYKTDDEGQEHHVSTLSSGSLIGSMSFVTGDVSFSTGRTLTRTQVIKIDHPLFSKIMTSRSELLPLFIQYLLLHFNQRLKRSIDTEIQLQQTLASLDEANRQLVEKEKMALLGQLVAGVAHELNNPVSAILRNSEALAEALEHVAKTPLDTDSREQALQLLQNNRNGAPLSTATARAHTRALSERMGDKHLARDLVNIGLYQQDDVAQWQRRLGNDFDTQITTWKQYARCGRLLRSNHVCATRIADLVKGLRTYARQDSEQRQRTHIIESIDDTLTLFEHQLKPHQLEKQYDWVPDMVAQPSALAQVWTNLIANAIDAMPEPGTLTVTVKTLNDQASGTIQVAISDTGIGMTQEQQEKMFALNYTTKREGHFGLGIGLTMCQTIIHQQGGDIQVHSQPGTGTTMTVTLPIELPASASKEPHV
ncbi:ATP-binding protein [Salinivibrio sp. ES.052]|uniref:ATP-binding protein n=1 Tax=Salinivibrio sp. ES.052 TaxID=1882823 RepID=UPI00092A86CD|nr:ATP-binding protein [Salinivibrio sp. ES.052]SIN82067.1 His Kinase A (phospho-acceptor) domain-containing protein [Salinivibrio sp. ES.052]